MRSLIDLFHRIFKIHCLHDYCVAQVVVEDHGYFYSGLQTHEMLKKCCKCGVIFRPNGKIYKWNDLIKNEKSK